jgi:pimeloyl-ACP methyl ester carboxylesterase
VPAADGFVALPDGGRLAYDDVGDPGGVPVLYLHGCPNARLARHPDDAIARTLGIRLLAIDRPGYGESSPPSDWSLTAHGDAIASVIDALGLERCAVLAWSAGAPAALAVAVARPKHVAHVAIVAGTMPNPSEGFTDAEIDEIVPLIVPDGLTLELALEHSREGASDAYLRDLDSIPGLDLQLARAAVAGSASGTTGAAFDIRTLASALPFDLAAVDVPVALFYGDCDDVSPVSTGETLARALPNARLEVVAGASHLLLLTHWSMLLDVLARQLELEE